MKERLWEFCRNSLKIIKKFDLNPDYITYTIIYLYFAGENKLLFEQVNTALCNRKLTDEFCEILYKRFVENINHEELEYIYSSLKELILNILDELNKTKDNVVSRDSIFEKYISRLSSKNIPIEELSVILKEAINELKSFRTECNKLSQSLTYGSDEIEKLRKKVEELQKKAEIDPLTGLFNRRVFIEKTEKLIKDIEHYPISLIFVDIDDFKKINDTYGHLIGDEVLKFISRKLKNNAKNQDIVARYGGEEFVLLLPNTSLNNAVQFAEKLRRLISEKSLLIKSNNKKIGKVTASFGVSEYKKGEEIANFIDRADKAVYISKSNGKNQVSDETFLYRN